MKVRIPTPLRSYTAQESVVEADGSTVDEILADLDRRYPGIRFRVVDEQGQLRKHMKVFVGEEGTRDLTTSVDGAEEVTLMQALSGGAPRSG
jgi:molybdopterin converting factor small subunit